MRRDGGVDCVAHGVDIRRLEVRCGNLFETDDVCRRADVVILAVDLSPAMGLQLAGILAGLKSGARLLTYLDLRSTTYPHPTHCPFERICPRLTFQTTWSDYHPFFLYRKL
jgi:hypothetical protein